MCIHCCVIELQLQRVRAVSCKARRRTVVVWNLQARTSLVAEAEKVVREIAISTVRLRFQKQPSIGSSSCQLCQYRPLACFAALGVASAEVIATLGLAPPTWAPARGCSRDPRKALEVPAGPGPA